MLIDNYAIDFMKKILFVLLMAAGLGACSSDNDVDFAENDTVQKQNTEYESSVLSVPSCFSALTGKVRVDVSNGIGNPVIVFTPVVPFGVSPTAKFKVRLEVQPLADCDDMNSNTGTLLTFGPAGTVQNVLLFPPSVSVMPASVPLCYKWRFVFEGIESVKRDPICYSASIWYESPLF